MFTPPFKEEMVNGSVALGSLCSTMAVQSPKHLRPKKKQKERERETEGLDEEKGT